MGQYSILIVDDERYVLRSIIRLLRDEGYNILTTESCKEALDIAAKNRIDLIISDYKMPQMSGIELVSRIKKILPAAKSIILTGYPQRQSGADIMSQQDSVVDVFIEKPWQNEGLKMVIKKLLKPATNGNQT